MLSERFIKPNIFLFENFKQEDHFTNSLLYILNLFPAELGNRFIKQLAVVSGISSEKLGNFEEAKFTGHHTNGF